jgi:predicted DCC family thiol-disulfide oxidoreductase YuxK
VPVAAALDRVLRSTAPARPLALARIVLAAVALAKAADLGPVLLRLADGEVLRLPYGPWSPDPSPALARALVAVWAGAGAAFLVGWRTRWAGALLVAAMALVLAVDAHLYSNHFYLAILLCLLLTVADSGAALSVDARRDGEREVVPGWPVTLLKLQLSIVYGYAVLAKLNAYYLSGTVLLVHWTRQGPYALPGPMRSFQVLAALSLLALLAEALLAVGLWSRRTRHPTLVVGLALHLAIIPTMGSTGQLTLFAAMMFAVYLLFLDAAPGSRLVVWDDHCAFCRDWVRSFRRLDWLRVHRFEGSSDPTVLAGAAIAREEADAALQLVTTTGTRLSGFDAVRSILEHLPASFLWAPVLRLPPVRWLGDRAYRRVAARRACEVPIRVEM